MQTLAKYATLASHRPRGVIVRAMLGLLRVSGEQPSSSLASATGVPSRWVKPILSYWLRLGLVACRKLGRYLYYRLAGEAAKAPEKVFWEWIGSDNLSALLEAARRLAAQLLAAELHRRPEPEEEALTLMLLEAHMKGRRVLEYPADNPLERLEQDCADYARSRGLRFRGLKHLAEAVVALRNAGVIRSSTKIDRRRGARFWIALTPRFLELLSTRLPLGGS
ncbi:MAG: hypothetical protein GXO09_04395 [Crenarchaeota archaeon]|nr:hypothetical protein [Thermoproteota archaeon]